MGRVAGYGPARLIGAGRGRGGLLTMRRPGSIRCVDLPQARGHPQGGGKGQAGQDERDSAPHRPDGLEARSVLVARSTEQKGSLCDVETHGRVGGWVEENECVRESWD